jgi:hypothetical protein
MAPLAFAVSVAFWPGLGGLATAPRWCLLAAGLPLVSWLDPRHLPPPLIWLLAIGISYACLSLLWAPATMTGINDLMMLVICVAALIAASALDDISPVLIALCVGVGISGLLAVIQVFGYSPIAQAIGSGWTTLRPAGLFYNRGVLAETAAPLLVWAACSRRVVLVLPLAIPLLLCQSREAILAAGVGACVAAVPTRGLRLTPSLGTTRSAGGRTPCQSGGNSLAASALIVMIAGGFTLATVAAVTLFGIGKFVSLGERLLIWQTTISDLTPFGHGIGSFFATYPHWETAHNDALQLVSELGIGAIPFLAIFAIGLYRGWPQTAERAALVALMVEGVVSFPLHMPTTAFLGMALVGSVACRGYDLRDLRPNRGGALGAVS